MSRVTLEDVAKKAGVSFKTVSRVLNNEPNVAPKTSERVKQAIAELNYVPNAAARRLSRGKAMSIGLVLGWPVNTPFASTLIEFTLKESMCNGYSVALFTLENNVSNQIVEAVLGRQIDGLIMDTIAGKNEDLQSGLKGINVPYLIVHPDSRRGHPKASFICIDEQKSTKLATNYLIQLGHRSIGYITYQSGLKQEAERLGGYREALDEAGIPFHNEWVYQDYISGFRVGFSGALYLLENYEEISAIVAETDEIAMGALGGIWKLGRKIPDDISVIGFDDNPYASMVAPPLTTIHQPIDEIACTAVEHLIQRIDNPSTKPIDLTMPTRLVVRETCKPPSTRLERVSPEPG